MFKPSPQVFPGNSDYQYMDVVSTIALDGVVFARTVIGLLTRPYETYRRILRDGRSGELAYIGVLMLFYFAVASMVKVAAFRPFLLTQEFLLLTTGAMSGAVISALCIVGAGKLLGATPRLVPVLIAWGYTLLPTVSWFIATSVLYIILPPPRTTSMPGIMFSMLFITFSVTLLWWKITLAYLTLRFALKVDLWKSVTVALLCAPVLALWSVMMYRFGIFKVPFL